ncbi:hypothetical protein NUW58_g4024 [Xylaria curta]|uniref:Uncharacterized protein n=1 Tax=Xylaria curta TaxID=42375 RepID=A0ACC1P885_9PEZI|nr:hypothetical protein NUW58_g4024 [Xylaria curta]
MIGMHSRIAFEVPGCRADSIQTIIPGGACPLMLRHWFSHDSKTSRLASFALDRAAPRYQRYYMRMNGHQSKRCRQASVVYYYSGATIGREPTPLANANLLWFEALWMLTASSSAHEELETLSFATRTNDAMEFPLFGWKPLAVNSEAALFTLLGSSYPGLDLLPKSSTHQRIGPGNGISAQLSNTVGGNRGIGLEIVKALLEAAPSDINSNSAPYHVYLGSRDLQKGKDVASKLPTAHGNTVSAIQLDITSPESVNNAVVAVKADSGRLDVLINNAGVGDDTIPDEATKMRTLYDINVIGTSRMTDAFKPLLLAQPADGGKTAKRLIHVSSSMGSIASRYNPEFKYYDQQYTAYRCTKAALGMLAACHAYDFKDDGVKVHAFDPGWAATEFAGSDPQVTRELGAVDPRVSGLACRDIVEGKRDGESNVIVSINGDTYPW